MYRMPVVDDDEIGFDAYPEKRTCPCGNAIARTNQSAVHCQQCINKEFSRRFQENPSTYRSQSVGNPRKERRRIGWSRECWHNGYVSSDDVTKFLGRK